MEGEVPDRSVYVVGSCLVKPGAPSSVPAPSSDARSP